MFTHKNYLEGLRNDLAAVLVLEVHTYNSNMLFVCVHFMDFAHIFSHKGRYHTCQFLHWVQAQQTSMHCSHRTFWFEEALWFSHSLNCTLLSLAAAFTCSRHTVYNPQLNETDTLRAAYRHFGKCRKSQTDTGVSEAGFQKMDIQK